MFECNGFPFIIIFFLLCVTLFQPFIFMWHWHKVHHCSQRSKYKYLHTSWCSTVFFKIMASKYELEQYYVFFLFYFEFFCKHMVYWHYDVGKGNYLIFVDMTSVASGCNLDALDSILSPGEISPWQLHDLERTNERSTNK